MSVRHIPYQIDEKSNRFHYYETLWKKRGLELLLKHGASEGKSLLDYGYGRGETLAMAGQAGFRVQGTDIDPECIKLATRYGPATRLNPNDPLGQFGRRSFDVVTCFHVLEHVDSPKQTLGALSQIAREYLVLAVPNLRYLHATFRRQFLLSGVNEGHLQSWDHWHFLNLAERHCNLKLVEWGTDATILPFASQVTQRLFGARATIWLETGLFRKLFPYHGVSVLGLFRPAS